MTPKWTPATDEQKRLYLEHRARYRRLFTEWRASPSPVTWNAMNAAAAGLLAVQATGVRK